MKILITGASGFIGSTLAKKLEVLGHEVVGLYRYVADGRYDYYQLDRKVVCDIRDSEGINKVLSEVKPEVVYHLAAITPVSYSFIHPVEVTEVNYLGTLNVAGASVKAGSVKQFIHASTSEFYGDQEIFPISEDAVPNPLSPYAASKVAAELCLWFLWRTEKLPVTVLRPYNTYNRSNVKKEYFVVERAITQALRNGHIHLYDPHPVRDFLDRDSHVNAYVRCLSNKRAVGEAINVGLGYGYTIEEMAQRVAEIVGIELGKEIKISWDMKPDRPYDIQRLICSNSKALRLLDWKPLYTFQEGLRLAIKEWREALGV